MLHLFSSVVDLLISPPPPPVLCKGDTKFSYPFTNSSLTSSILQTTFKPKTSFPSLMSFLHLTSLHTLLHAPSFTVLPFKHSFMMFTHSPSFISHPLMFLLHRPSHHTLLAVPSFTILPQPRLATSFSPPTFLLMSPLYPLTSMRCW